MLIELTNFEPFKITKKPEDRSPGFYFMLYMHSSLMLEIFYHFGVVLVFEEYGK